MTLPTPSTPDGGSALSVDRPTTRAWRTARAAGALLFALALTAGLAAVLTTSSVTSAEPSRQQKSASPVQRLGLTDAPARFKHDQHDTTKCTKCHFKGDDDASKTRPGRKDHSPCDNGSCHGNLFYEEGDTKTERRVCQVCHMEKNPEKWMDLTKMQPYPSQLYSERTFRVEFSHKKHVGYENSRVENCSTCHLGGPKSEGEGVKPSHANCGQCHASGGAIKPTLDDCDSCHIKNEGDKRRTPWRNDRVDARKACRVGLIELSYEDGKSGRVGKFSHKKHLDYGETTCSDCHDNVRNADKLSDIVLFGDWRGVKIKTEVCGNKACHSGKKDAAFSVKGNCSNCHGPGCKTESYGNSVELDLSPGGY